MIKKKFIVMLYIFFTSCGFQPILKGINTDTITIKKINYSGDNKLTYLLQSNLGFVEKQNSSGYIVDLNIAERTESITKDTFGITKEEEITVDLFYIIKNHNQDILNQEKISEKAKVILTESISADETYKQNEKIRLIEMISQKLKIKLLILNNKDQK